MTLAISRSRAFRLAALVGVGVMLGAVAADARPGNNRSSGSRGERTYAAPPATNTAPSAAQPMQRSVTPAPAPSAAPVGSPAAAPAATAARPGAPAGAAAPAAAQRSPFGALGMGLAAGFLGAGLFGMFSGAGFLSGLGSFMGFIGFLFQILLIVGVVWLVMRLVRGRRDTQASGPVPAYARTDGQQGGLRRGPMPPMAQPIPGMAGGSVAAPAPQPTDTIGIGPQDYGMFERRLVEIQEAYGRGDLASLRASATPEMVSYFAEDLKADEDQGLFHRISDIRLLQGDLAEAWREADSDYATVAMRYSLVDLTLERASGRVVRGDQRGEEVVELWTFRRQHGGAWLLSAIQQTT